MKFPLRFAGLFLLTVTPLLGQPFGLTNRVANTTLRMPGSLPVTGYGVSNAFPGVIFQQPIAFASPPGETNRLFILEREGRVTVITNIASPNRTVFMDISGPVTTDGEEGLLGIAFHPNYAANRYFYLFYSLVTTTDAGPTRHQRISRFQTSASNPNQGVVASELPLITQRDEFSNHNGGDIHFGPDGYLYISLGDEGGQNDAGDNSQRIDKDFFAGIIRIDVDKLPANLPPNPHPARMGQTNYFVPADNPFVGATQFNGRAITNVLRTEWWAVGLRNPWRISFDPLTGALYAGDVGGSQREEVNLITRGGNYGWVYREGLSNTTIKTINAPPGFTSLPPIHEYTRGTAQNQGNSITGGVIYRGTRIPSLTGKYIFCDYGSGNIWALTPNGTNYVASQFLADDPNIVAFGIDPSNGDVLMADIADPAVPIKRLAPAIISGSPPPATLADTGAFSDMANLTPHAGIIPYDVNVPVWHDGAIMTRWFCISNVASRIQFRSTSPWTFPASTVWIQHLELELTNGVPASRRRVETRFLVRESTGAGVYGVTYRWGNSTTNATLVPDAGMDEEFVINDSGIVRTQVWHYPTRNECVTCHATPAGRALGFNTAQLNRDFNYNGVVDNQIRSLNNAGYFLVPGPTNLNLLYALAHPADESYSLAYRSRSWIMANCAQCHIGISPGQFDARIFTPTASARLINGPLNDSGGDTNNRVIVPGSVSNSMLLTRLSSTASNRMPPLGVTQVDTQAVALLTRWIEDDLPSYQTFAQWQLAHFGSTNAPQAAATADPDGDLAQNMLEYLTGTDPNAGTNFWQLGVEPTAGGIDVVYERIANRHFELQWTTNLVTNVAPWRVLDVPANRPFAAASNNLWRVSSDTTNSPQRYYRARVYEP